MNQGDKQEDRTPDQQSMGIIGDNNVTGGTDKGKISDMKPLKIMSHTADRIVRKVK